MLYKNVLICPCTSIVVFFFFLDIEYIYIFFRRERAKSVKSKTGIWRRVLFHDNDCYYFGREICWQDEEALYQNLKNLS